MVTPNERLRISREKAGFDTAKAAAESMGMPVSTYIQHENGTRGFPAGRAPQYARKFKVAEQWLLYGKGDGPTIPLEPSEEDLAQMIDEALDELPLETKRGDLPRIVAPILHEQLKRFRADRATQTSEAGTSAPDKSSQSRSATKPAAQA